MTVFFRILLTSLGGLTVAALLSFGLTSASFFSHFGFESEWRAYARKMAEWHVAHPVPDAWARTGALDGPLHAPLTRWTGVFTAERRQIHGIPILPRTNEWLQKVERVDRFQATWITAGIREVIVPLDGMPGHFLLAEQWGAVAGLPPPDSWLVEHLWLIRGTIVAVIVAFVAALVSAYATGPVRRLRRLATAVEAGEIGYTDAALAARTDEIGILAREIERMGNGFLDRLRRQQAIIDNVSRLLAAPVQRIRMAKEMLNDAKSDNHRLVNRLSLDADALSEILARLACSIEAHPEPAAIDLFELCRKRSDDFALAAREKQQVIECRGGSVVLHGLADLLESAIDNLILNAIKYGTPGTPIRVQVETAGTDAMVTVANQSATLSQTDRLRMFDPFFRAGIHRDERNYRGSGIGLAITKRSIEVHGGTVRALENPLGGIIVQLSLPLRSSTIASGLTPPRATDPSSVPPWAGAHRPPLPAWLGVIGEGLYFRTMGLFVATTLLVLLFSQAATSPSLFSLFPFTQAWQEFATEAYRDLDVAAGKFHHVDRVFTARPDFWTADGLYYGPIRPPLPPHIPRIQAQHVPAASFIEIAAPEAGARSLVFPMLDPRGWTAAIHQPAEAAGLPPPNTLLFALVWPIRLFLLTIGFIVVAGCFAVFLSFPLRQLAELARRSAEGRPIVMPGRLLARHDEIGFLANDLQSMVARLEQHLARQRQIVRDVTHELRSPLARIRVATSLLDGGDEELTSGLSKRMEGEIAELDGLIDRILMLSRLDTLGDTTAFDRIDFHELCTRTVEAHGLHDAVRLRSPSGERTVLGDERILGQAISRILSIAGRPGGGTDSIRVDVACTSLQVRLRVTIHSQHPGGTELVEWFGADHATGVKTLPDGGMDLLIARRAVELHGGALILLRRSAPEGYAIEISLPLANLAKDASRRRAA